MKKKILGIYLMHQRWIKEQIISAWKPYKRSGSIIHSQMDQICLGKLHKANKMGISLIGASYHIFNVYTMYRSILQNSLYYSSESPEFTHRFNYFCCIPI